MQQPQRNQLNIQISNGTQITQQKQSIQIPTTHQNSQDQTNKISISIEHPKQQNEPKQHEEKLSDEQTPNETPKIQEEQKNNDQITPLNSHSDDPRVKIDKRSSDSKLLFTLKGGQQFTKKKEDNQSPKPLIIVAPNKNIPQLQQQAIRPSEPQLKIEKRLKKTDDCINIDFKNGIYGVETLKNGETQSQEIIIPITQGFVALQNYLLEMQNYKSNKPQYGYEYGRSQKDRSKKWPI